MELQYRKGKSGRIRQVFGSEDDLKLVTVSLLANKDIFVFMDTESAWYKAITNKYKFKVRV